MDYSLARAILSRITDDHKSWRCDRASNNILVFQITEKHLTSKFSVIIDPKTIAVGWHKTNRDGLEGYKSFHMPDPNSIEKARKTIASFRVTAQVVANLPVK